jgi:peptidoglycan L-alanyl-D-glutamate endopeptidase CwlK
MNAIDVLKSAAPARQPRIERGPVQRDDTPDSISPEKRAERARFAQVLALLAATGDKTRADLMSQMKPGDASLLDKLLTDAGDGAMGETGDTTDALRYAMMNENRNAASLNQGSELRGLHGIARAASRNGNIETIARLASRRGSSVEELLALGDNTTAELKTALEALLANAGTPEAAALAEGLGTDPSTLAHAAALESARAKSAADVNAPVRDEAALAPEFRARIDRVVERMKNEFGHDVELVETARSQERQDHLFEQGRSRSGPVVTWTRDSAHLTGHAADVVVDGKWNNAEGYARLQQVAREEGLRTLGMRDPGHLEMPKEERSAIPGNVVAQAAAAAKALTNASANSALKRPVSQVDASTANGIASAPGIARVAGVAQVAGVARVADNASSVSQVASAHGMNTSSEARSKDAGNSGSARDDGERGRAGYEQSQMAFGARGAAMSSDTASVHRTAAAGADAFNRVMEAERVRDAAPARPVSQLTLQVDAPNGGTDEIRIGMRGNVVNTQIVTDAQNAERLRVRTGELQDALGRHGLESDSVRISSIAKADSIDSSKGGAGIADRDALKVGVAQQSQQGDGTSQHNQRDRAANARDWQERQDARRERDEQRQSDNERQRRGPFNPDSK